MFICWESSKMSCGFTLQIFQGYSVPPCPSCPPRVRAQRGKQSWGWHETEGRALCLFPFQTSHRGTTAGRRKMREWLRSKFTRKTKKNSAAAADAAAAAAAAAAEVMAAEEIELPAVLFKTLEVTCDMAACGQLADFQHAALCFYEGKLVMWVSRRLSPRSHKVVPLRTAAVTRRPTP